MNNSHQDGDFTITISGPASISPSIRRDGEFTITISGPTSSPALSLGSDVTPAARSGGGSASRPALAGGGSRPTSTVGGRHIVMDWSNISISAMNHADGRGKPNKDVRINIPKLNRLLEAGCPIRTRYVAGSIPSRGKVPSYWAEFHKLGYVTKWLSRDHQTGAEKGVDSSLHAVGQQIILDKLQKSNRSLSTETLILLMAMLILATVAFLGLRNQLQTQVS